MISPKNPSPAGFQRGVYQILLWWCSVPPKKEAKEAAAGGKEATPKTPATEISEALRDAKVHASVQLWGFLGLVESGQTMNISSANGLRQGVDHTKGGRL